MPIPESKDLVRIVFRTIQALGRNASNKAIHDKIADALQLTNQERQAKENSRQTVLSARLTQARSELKSQQLIEKSKQGVWVLTTKGKEANFSDYSTTVGRSQKSKAGLSRTHTPSNNPPSSITIKQRIQRHENLPGSKTDLVARSPKSAIVPPTPRAIPITAPRQRDSYHQADVMRATRAVLSSTPLYYSRSRKK